MPDRSLEDEIRDAYPEAGPPGEAERARARAALASELEEPPARPRRGVPRSGLRWFIPVGAAFATAIVAAVVLIGAPGEGVEPSSAAEVLQNAADAERELAPPLPGPGEYLYVKSENVYLASYMGAVGSPAPPPGAKPPTEIDEDEARPPSVDFAYLEPEVREVWIGERGSQLETQFGEPVFLTEEDREAWVADGRPGIRNAVAGDPLGSVKPLDVPSDPDELFEELRAEAARYNAEPDVPSAIFDRIGDSLRERSATPEQRAALFEVAAMLDGIELVGEVEDPQGRPGIAVAMVNEREGVRNTFVFDPETWVLLSEETVIVDEDSVWGYDVGTRIGYAVYLERAIVNEAGERP